MAENKLVTDLALQALKSPPPVNTKLNALDALDRLALNPSGWFSDSVLDQLTDARKAIITDRWPRALTVLETTRQSMEGFVGTLKGTGEVPAERKSALERAQQEIQQLVLVLGWLDTRPAN